jgi:hypothetical protein
MLFIVNSWMEEAENAEVVIRRAVRKSFIQPS